jgi:16S rRNA (uracil1498-N3)-methyltransferase
MSQPLSLNQVLKASSGVRVVLSEIEQDIMLKDAIPADTAALTLAFGPEGGWKQDELDSFRTAGWISASLGATILRAETAAIAATAIAASALDRR